MLGVSLSRKSHWLPPMLLIEAGSKPQIPREELMISVLCALALLLGLLPHGVGCQVAEHVLEHPSSLQAGESRVGEPQSVICEADMLWCPQAGGDDREREEHSCLSAELWGCSQLQHALGLG